MSESLLEDQLPVGAWINQLLLRSMYADHFGEITVDAMSLIERATGVWDSPIFEDDEDWADE